MTGKDKIQQQVQKRFDLIADALAVPRIVVPQDLDGDSYVTDDMVKFARRYPVVSLGWLLGYPAVDEPEPDPQEAVMLKIFLGLPVERQTELIVAMAQIATERLQDAAA